MSLKLTSKSLQTMYHCVTNTHMYIQRSQSYRFKFRERHKISSLLQLLLEAVDAMFLLSIELTSNKTVFTISITPQWTSSHHYILQMLQLYNNISNFFVFQFKCWEMKWRLNTKIENKKLNCSMIFLAKYYCAYKGVIQTPV